MLKERRKYNLQVIRVKRKTISLQVKDEFTIVIKAPNWVTQSEIDRLIEEKTIWIDNQIVKLMRKNNTKDKFLYLGKLYEIVFHFQSTVSLVGGICYIPKVKNANKYLDDWMKLNSYEIFEERLKYYSSLMGIKYKNFKLIKASTRYGTCSRNGNIKLNHLLLKAPIEVIDYVVVHELSHITYFNHSRSFYNYLSRYAPTYKKCKKWLRDNYLLDN